MVAEKVALVIVHVPNVKFHVFLPVNVVDLQRAVPELSATIRLRITLALIRFYFDDVIHYSYNIICA